MSRLIALGLTGVLLAGCRGAESTTGPGGTPPIVVTEPPTGIASCTVPSATGAVDMIGDTVTPFSPQLGATVVQPVAPPAISGGTLRLLADRQTVVAADPDRDQVYIVDLSTRAVTATVVLKPGDEPGRLVEDAAGRVHVALRHGGALVTIDPVAGSVTGRREVCGAPRGVAYEAATDRVHVACAGGELVSLPAAGGVAVRKLQLERDLRDVVVDGKRLRVSRFRSAELLTVDADGTVMGRATMPTFRSVDARGGQLFSPAVAWRTMEMPGGGVAMLHQRGVDDDVQAVRGGYGGFDPCHTIVHAAVTVERADGTVASGPALAGLVTAVDMAISPDGARVAIVATGNAHSATPAFAFGPTSLFVTDMEAVTSQDQAHGCRPDGKHGPCGDRAKGLPPLPALALQGEIDETGADAADAGTGAAVASGGGTTGTDTGTDGGTGAGGAGTGGRSGTGGRGVVDAGRGATTQTTPCGTPMPPVSGEPVAVIFTDGGDVVVQSREPALLSFADGTTLALSTDTRNDTGHLLFHVNAGSSLACASCHPEGQEDGRVWNFTCSGPRRTQSLQVGLGGTEPFHWNGDEKDFPALVRDVFMGRMSGPTLVEDQMSATFRWIDAQPRVARPVGTDAAAAGRGRALFEDQKRTGCVTCHAGAQLTNNTTVDVGTGGMFQVPSLIGISNRAPFMHDGCAPTLRARFSEDCGGGDKHGVTSTLSATELSDLIAYLETL